MHGLRYLLVLTWCFLLGTRSSLGVVGARRVTAGCCWCRCSVLTQEKLFVSRASGKPQDTLSLERLGHFLCVASFMVPLSGCNLVALHLSPGREESKAQTGYPTCRSCPPSLGPSRAHAQRSRACGMNAYVHIHLIGHFSGLWLIVGAFSPNPSLSLHLIIKPPSFLGFLDQNAIAHTEPVSLLGVRPRPSSCSRAQGTRASPTANPPTGTR